MKVAFTVGELKELLNKFSDDLPLSESITAELGYNVGNQFYSLEDEPEKGFISVRVGCLDSNVLDHEWDEVL